MTYYLTETTDHIFVKKYGLKSIGKDFSGKYS